MKKRNVIAMLFLAMFVALIAFPVQAQELDNIQKQVGKGRVIQASQVFSSIASTTNREILVKPTKDCLMVGQLMLSAVGQTNGPTIVVFENVTVSGTTNGTMLKVANLKRGSRNWFGVYAYSEPTLTAYGSTNAKYILAQTENGAVPALFPAPIALDGGIDYMIRITNSGAATTDISIVLQFTDD